MKALIYTGVQEVVYTQAHEPEPGIDDVIVEIAATAICGSDLHAYHGLDSRRVPPLILGHEVSGIALSGKFQGQKVVVNPLITCGNCNDCMTGRSNLCYKRELIGMVRPGAYAQRVAIAQRNLLLIPQDMDMHIAALSEPTATAVHAIAQVERISVRPLSELKCMVIGGGAIGVLCALILKAKGCFQPVLAETNSLRRNSIKEMGVTQVWDPLNESIPTPKQFDLVFDCVGSGLTRQSSCQAIRPGGIISHIGLQDEKSGLNTRQLTLDEVTFIGNYCYTNADLLASIKLLYSGQLGRLNWIEQRPLSEGAQAFSDLHHANVGAAKIVLIPD